MIDIQLVGLLIWLALCVCACVIRLCMGSRSVPPPVPRPSIVRVGMVGIPGTLICQKDVSTGSAAEEFTAT